MSSDPDATAPLETVGEDAGVFVHDLLVRVTFDRFRSLRALWCRWELAFGWVVLQIAQHHDYNESLRGTGEIAAPIEEHAVRWYARVAQSRDLKEALCTCWMLGEWQTALDLLGGLDG